MQRAPTWVVCAYGSAQRLTRPSAMEKRRPHHPFPTSPTPTGTTPHCSGHAAQPPMSAMVASGRAAHLCPALSLSPSSSPKFFLFQTNATHTPPTPPTTTGTHTATSSTTISRSSHGASGRDGVAPGVHARGPRRHATRHDGRRRRRRRPRHVPRAGRGTAGQGTYVGG